MKNPLAYLFWLIVLGGIINYFFTVSYVTNQTREEMKEAYVEYVRGETAQTIGERKEAFNNALKLYTSFEEEYQPKFSDGKLYFNIANSYFQLEEYPMAVLYYNRALKLRPRDEKVKHNLKVAYEKLGIDSEKKGSVFEKVFFFYYNYSIPERLQAFFALSIIALISGSAFIWQRKKWMKQLAVLAVLLAAVMLLTLGYSHYIASIEGIITRSTVLYRDSGLQYAKVIEEPVLSGEKVEVLDVLKEGKWLKILTPDGHLGYVPDDSIKII